MYIQNFSIAFIMNLFQSINILIEFVGHKLKNTNISIIQLPNEKIFTMRYATDHSAHYLQMEGLILQHYLWITQLIKTKL